MKLVLIILFLSSLLISKPVLCQVDLVIKNVTIISSINKHQADEMYDYWLTIKDGVIVEISNSDTPPKSKQVIDAKGQFLIPGLMDSHTHLKTMPGLNRQSASAEKMQQAFLQRQGANYLYYGVTQVIDPSNTQSGIDTFHASGVTPDAFFCGAMPIYKGYNAIGYSHSELRKHRPYYLAQKSDPKTSAEITEAHQVKNAITRLVNDGAVCAKVYIEDGFDFANHIPLVATETLKELSSYATQLNLPVMAHANASDMQTIAVDSGVNIMGHGLWNWLEEQKLANEKQLPPKVRHILSKIIEQEIAYQPTLNVIRSLRDMMVKNYLEQPGFNKVLPDWQIKWYLSKEGQWFVKEMIEDWGGVSLEGIINSFTRKDRNGLRVAKYLYDNGATILLATDTPPAPTYASQPGVATYKELTALNQTGIDLHGLLAAATINGAKAYNLAEKYGTVEVGKIANLLLLELNPLETVEAYDSINTVILNGEAIKRESLHVNNLTQQKP